MVMYENAPIYTGKSFFVYEDKEKEIRMVFELAASSIQVSQSYDEMDYLHQVAMTFRANPPHVTIEGDLVIGKVWDGGDPFAGPKPAIDEGTKQITDGDEVVKGEIIEDEFEDHWRDDE